MIDEGETQLVTQLATIEASHAGVESGARAQARDRIRARLRESPEPPIAVRFAIHDPWERRLFCALARRYGLVPYRERGQRRTSIMLKVPQRFLDAILWPEHLELSAALRAYLEVVTQRVIAKAIHEDGSEEEDRDGAAGSG